MNKKIFIFIIIVIIILITSALLYIKFKSYPWSTAERNTPSPYEFCDMDRDMDCDNNDLNIFNTSLDSCRGDSNYYTDADVDGSGCVTIYDKQVLFLSN